MEKEEKRVRDRVRQLERERERKESKGIKRHNNTYSESGFLFSFFSFLGHTVYIWLLQNNTTLISYTCKLK